MSLSASLMLWVSMLRVNPRLRTRKRRHRALYVREFRTRIFICISVHGMWACIDGCLIFGEVFWSVYLHDLYLEHLGSPGFVVVRWLNSRKLFKHRVTISHI